MPETRLKKGHIRTGHLVHATKRRVDSPLRTVQTVNRIICNRNLNRPESRGKSIRNGQPFLFLSINSIYKLSPKNLNKVYI